MQKTEFCKIYEDVTGHNLDDSPLSANLLANAPLKFYSQIAVLCGNDPNSIVNVFDILTVILPLREQETIEKAARREKTLAEFNEKRRNQRYMQKVMHDALSGLDSFQEIDEIRKIISNSLPSDVAAEMARKIVFKDTPPIPKSFREGLNSLSRKSDQSMDRQTKANIYFNRAIYEIYIIANKTASGQSIDWICMTIKKVLDSLHIVKSNGNNFDRREIRRIVENTRQ